MTVSVNRKKTGNKGQEDGSDGGTEGGGKGVPVDGV